MSRTRRYAEWVSKFSEARRGALYSDDFLESLPEHDPIEFLEAAFSRSSKRDAITSTTLTDIVSYLPCDLCNKVDIASMAHGLECRQPLLDHRLVETAITMPISEKMKGKRGKVILREAFGHMLPSEVFTRKKMGFGVPLDSWFRNELKDYMQEILLDDLTFSRGYFRKETIQQMVKDHISNTFDHSARIWTLLMLELWCREWID